MACRGRHRREAPSRSEGAASHQHEDVPVLEHRGGHLRPVPLAAAQVLDLLGLLARAEAEGGHEGPRVHAALAEVQGLSFPGDGLKHRLAGLGVEVIPRLVHRGQLHGAAHADRAACYRLLAREHLDQSRLAGAVRPDDAHHRCSRNFKRQVVDENATTKLLP